MTLKARIIDYAKSIGVDLIGFTSAEPFEDIRGILEVRRDMGYLSGFEEEDIELRIDPKRTLEDAKSIIVIAMSYFIKDAELEKEQAKFHGELARTAWGIDYHQVLSEKLGKIADFIKEKNNNFKHKSFVDTGPLVDRHIAYRGGLGWYGYNNLLINEVYGSWIFIGYMINNMEFEEDEPLINNKCLGCNLCIKHCPKGALEEPYKFNANKCISNILQKKEFISEEDRLLLGKGLYGCDICQGVCPHNRNVEETKNNDFMPQHLHHKPNLVELLNISNRNFQQSYGKTSAGWRGKKILQRNAIIALVNHKDPEAISYILPLLKDQRKEIRRYAIWAIYKLDPKLAYTVLNEMKEYEKEEELIEDIDYYVKKIVE